MPASAYYNLLLPITSYYCQDLYRQLLHCAAEWWDSGTPSVARLRPKMQSLLQRGAAGLRQVAVRVC